jgi:DNA-binding transcriptional MerR regulator
MDPLSALPRRESQLGGVSGGGRVQGGAVQVRLGIGDFSRMTYLSVKALRHYHDVGVLAPAEIDPASGYRYYAPNQVSLAQMIRRLRDLGVPLADVKAIVQAPDEQTRDRALIAHLARMERQLEETQQTVASLRTLLQRAPDQVAVEYRDVPVTPALAIREQVRSEVGIAWWMDAFTLLHKAVRYAGVERTGPDGVLFSSGFFELEEGEVTAFVPVSGAVTGTRWPERVRQLEIPAARLAVTLHTGPFNDLDLTYGALGTYVLEHAAGAPGPIREYYLPTGDPADLLAHTTEVCWPVTP